MGNGTDAAFDPDVVVPEPSAAVRAHIERCPAGRIQRIDIGGRSAWLKRAARTPPPFWQRPLRRLGHKYSTWVAADEPAAHRIAREARRLVALRAAGFNVPEVIAATPGWMLTEDCGPTAREMIRHFDADARRRLIGAMAVDLAQLHAAGYWHGGAQIKNTTLMGGERYRIDFETGFAPGVTVPDLQGRDLFLFLMSCADYADDCPLPSVLGRYAVEGGRAAAIGHAADGVRPFRRAWQRLLPGRDVRRGLAAADALLSFS